MGKLAETCFEGAINFFGKVADCVSTVWNNFLSPLVNWLVSFWALNSECFQRCKRVFDNVFTFIGGLVNSILKTFGGLIDFITGVFSGDWKKHGKVFTTFSRAFGMVSVLCSNLL